MSEEPQYYTTATLMAAAGVRPTQFHRHLNLNVGGIQSAREKHEGLGVRFDAKKSRKYIALASAGRKRASTEGGVTA